MRPASIVNFERLYLGALVIGVINTVLTFETTLAQVEAQPGAESMGSNIFYISLAIGFLIPILLWYFVARRASVVAKWIVVVLFVLGVFGFLFSFSQPVAPEGIALILGIVSMLMQAAAVWMLFRPDAKAWFADGRGGPDPEVFR